ncbi:uncharacterized protein LOC113208734 isoform X2 [Frankliniella occidentalis]|uniref:Uncharacterized protein LOC113208734 isoform X2 n=1 Tax=Frankliniella occidentalis TaxID=133901 RepID=A0A9C6TYW9_FRAOC|nr:uncharacterized protein LOC113208734 isoform X2 [Frankliniella occidentalis]
MCPNHFDDSQFWNKFKTKLRLNAVPTIFAYPELSPEVMQKYDNPDVFFFSGFNDESDCDDSPDTSSPLTPIQCGDDIMDCTEESSDQVHSGKRSREIYIDDDDSSFESELKNPHLDLPQATSPRRSLISTGARDRDGKQHRIGLQNLAEMSGVQYDSNDENLDKVLKTAQQYRTMALDVRRKLSIAQRRNKNLTKVLNNKTLTVLNELVVSPVARVILEGEMKNFKVKPRGRRWTLQDKLFWLGVMKRGVRAFRFLAKYMTIPSEASLKNLLNKVNLAPGISQPFLSLLKKKVELMKSRDRQCVLLFDEVFLRGRVFYNLRKDLVIGFENYGQRGRTNYIADHALVFMVQGLHVKWTQPVAYYFVSKTCPSTMLKILIEDVVKALTSIGLTVKATVSDQGPTNRSAIAELRQKNGDGLLYSIDGQRLVHIWDMPHILKNIRNNLITSDLEFNGNKVAKWRHLIEFFKYDESLSKLSSLSMRHINPQGRDKMRVSYAAQVFSASVSKFIKAIVSISDGKKLSHCLPFADLCEDIDSFFDLCNGPRAKENNDQKLFRVNVTDHSPHIKEDMWNTIISKLQTWTFIRKKDGVRHIPPCVRGWIENVKSFRVLWCSVKEEVRVLKLRHLNQDALENFFCLIRQCGGSSSDLTLAQFTASMKTCLISRFSRLVSADSKNCLDDESFMMSDLSQYLLSEEDPSTAPPVQQSLHRGDTPDNFGRRPRVQPTNLLVRQAPTEQWIEILPSLLKKIDCSHCSNLLTSSQPPLFYNSVSSQTSFPSPNLISIYLSCQNVFERQWKRVLFKENVSSDVATLFQNAVQWEGLLCPAHHNAKDTVNILFSRISENLIQQKCRDCNAELRAKVSRRTRQALVTKNSTGLRTDEEEVELDPEDQILLGIMTGLLHSIYERVSSCWVLVLFNTG